MDTYLHFDQLRKPEQEGMDYVILHRTGSSGILVMAPHAGGIEPGTGDIADAVAAQNHAFYCFKGIKKQGNRVLHISSNRFDEPLAMQRATEANWIVTFHGCRDVEPVVWVGGLALQRGDRIIESLQAAGFPARRCDRPGLRGLDPKNVCNRGRDAAGVQLEVSFGLRHLLFTDLFRRRIRSRTLLFYRFVETLAGCLLSDEIPMGTRPEADPLSTPSEKGRKPKSIDKRDPKQEAFHAK
ncbi:MAG: poly-gamma-glutamate hydrolase family protein [Deltaproteobacteria bacterium]|nr:poly-gamma-glutamate hydrolase family protein [Deltaproteobacteria bacterium]